MGSRINEYAGIICINLAFSVIMHCFLGGIPLILIAYMTSVSFISILLWCMYILTLYLVIRGNIRQEKWTIPEIIRLFILIIGFLGAKMLGDFVFTKVELFNINMRRTAVLSGAVGFLWGGILIVVLFFVIKKLKAAWNWKRIRVPAVILILIITLYGIFVWIQQNEYLLVTSHYGKQENIDLYYAYRIADGNPWFYAAFVIILWWFMRRLTDPAETSEKIKNNETFSFNSQKSENGKELTVLLSTLNDIEAEIIRDLLKENGIFTVIRDRESGDAMKLYMGNSIFEKEILVNSGEYDRAKKLIEDTSTDAGEEMSEYKELAKQRELKRRTFTVYVLALIVIFVLLALVIK